MYLKSFWHLLNSGLLHIDIVSLTLSVNLEVMQFVPLYIE